MSNNLEAMIKQLNEAELMLSTALYQSKQKLNILKKANRPVNSEDLIRYAHNISSQHSVASPLDWHPGDPRRPYPTDLLMRQSLLAGNAPSASEATTYQFVPTSLPGPGSTKKVKMNEKDESVDLMSTDSSSSYSSDSQ